MADVSLGEIAGIRGDANIGLAAGGGNDAVIAPATTELAYLNAAAQTRNQANQFLYNEHQKNIQNSLKNFNATDVTGVFSPDYKDITDQYRNLAGQIYDNYDVLANPMKNPQLYSQIMQQQASLDAKIAQSKQHALLDTENKKFLQAHPDFSTPENLAAIQKFQTTPIGERQILNLAPPTVIDPIAALKAADEYSKKSLATAKVKNGYIVKQTSEGNDPVAYMNGIKAYLAGSNGYGGTYGDAIQKQLVDYNRANPAGQLTYDEFLDKTFAPNIKAMQVTKSDIDADPYGISNLNFAHQKALEAIRNANDRENIFLKAGLDKKSTSEKGDFINSETAKLFLNQGNSKKELTISPASGGANVVEKVATLTPSQMKLFAVPIVPTASVNGKAALATPDVITYTPDGNLRVMFYGRDSANGVGPEAADKKSGRHSIDQSLTQIYTPDEVRATIATHVSPSQYDDVMFEANRALEKVTGSQRFDQSSIDKYAQAHGLLPGTTSQQPTTNNNTSTSLTIRQSSSKPISVSSQAQYDAVPAGAQYIAPDGKVYIKK